MTRRFLALFLMFATLLSEAKAGPRLAAAYAAQDSVGSALLPPVPPDEGLRIEEQRLRYLRARDLHRVGVIVGAVGAVAFVPSGFLWITSVFAQGDQTLTAVGAILTTASAVAIVGGETAAFTGAFQAAGAVQAAFGSRVDRAYGIGGLVVLGVGLLCTPITSGLSAAIGVAGGLVLSAVQMGVASRTLAELGVASIRIVPTPGGVVVALALR